MFECLDAQDRLSHTMWEHLDVDDRDTYQTIEPPVGSCLGYRGYGQYWVQ